MASAKKMWLQVKSNHALKMEQVLYKDSAVVVYYCEGESDYLVLTFNEMGSSPGNGAWAGHPLQKNKISYIGFVSTEPNWFPKSSMFGALLALTPVLSRYKSFVTYGHSQGGYAAIRYATLFRANLVLAFCPQYSIRPASMDARDSRFSRYFKNDFQHDDIDGSHVPTDCQVYVFYDPLDRLDKLNVEFIRARIPTIHQVKVFGTGHQTVRSIASSQAVRGLLEAGHLNDPVAIRRAVHSAKRTWSMRPFYLARQAAKRSKTTAIRLLESSNEEISTEILDELVTNLFLSGGYEWLAANIERLIRNTHVSNDRSVKNTLLSSLIAADKRLLAIDFLSTWAWEDANYKKDLVNLLESTKAACDNVVNSGNSEFAVFGEGWHGTESWGRWSSSTRARLYLQPLVGGVVSLKSVKIPIRRLDPESQTLKVRYFRANKWHEAEASQDAFVIPLLHERVAVDIFVSDLVCPYVRKFGPDRRLLGVSIDSEEKWIAES